jgi:ubiquinone/menaquinone biosynthesis C-methylase UbiE
VINHASIKDTREEPMSRPDYPFNTSDHERQRLMRQANILADTTERLLRKAQIGPGMRVLDIGSGAGDVAFLARRLVGESGEIIGTDRDGEQVSFANQRAASLGYGNVRFVQSDFASLTLDKPVDAISGRLVLLFAKDPTAAVAGVCRNLRGGGVVAFLESNFTFDAPVLVEPRNSLAGKAVWWIAEGLKHAGVQPRLGLRLFSIMKDAGLEPSPQIESTLNVGQGPEGHLFPYLVDLVRSAMDSIIASGAATAEEIDIDSLEQRLVADAPVSGVVGTISSGVLGIVARKPFEGPHS